MRYTGHALTSPASDRAGIDSTSISTPYALAACKVTAELEDVLSNLHREYLARKNANEGKGDAVFTQLQYAPACPHMPVCKGRCEQPVFAWVRAFAEHEQPSCASLFLIEVLALMRV